MSAKFKVSVGDRVALSAAFLRQIGVQTGELPQLRGNVVELCRFGERDFARVKWDGQDESRMILPDNLAKPGPNSRYCAC